VNARNIPWVTVSKLLIFNKKDEIVTFSMGHMLLQTAPEQKISPIKEAIGWKTCFETLAGFARKGEIN